MNKLLQSFMFLITWPTIKPQLHFSYNFSSLQSNKTCLRNSINLELRERLNQHGHFLMMLHHSNFLNKATTHFSKLYCRKYKTKSFFPAEKNRHDLFIFFWQDEKLESRDFIARVQVCKTSNEARDSSDKI